MTTEQELMNAVSAIAQIALCLRAEGEQAAKTKYARAIEHLNNMVASVAITKELTHDKR